MTVITLLFFMNVIHQSLFAGRSSLLIVFIQQLIGKIFFFTGNA